MRVARARAWTRGMAAISVLSALAAGGAAVAAEEPARRWTDQAEFGLVVASGNSDVTTVSFANTFRYRWERSSLTVDATALRTETTRRTPANVAGSLVVDEVTEITAENYKLAGKYSGELRAGFTWYAAAGWERDRLAGIDRRTTYGGGFGYQILDTERQKLSVEAGADFTDESYSSSTDPDSASFAGARGFIGYERKLSESAGLKSGLELLQNLEETDDLRANFVTSVTASLTSRLALKVGYTVKYDKDPVTKVLSAPGFDDVVFRFDTTDTILSTSLVIDF